MKKMPHKKILIVEDEQHMAHVMELKLTNAGYETVIAKNGEEALERVAERSFDLILLDLVMPVKDGFAVLEELQKKSFRAPIFVVTNLGQEEDAERVKKLGAKKYIIKSETPLSDLVSLVAAELLQV